MNLVTKILLKLTLAIGIGGMCIFAIIATLDFPILCLAPLYVIMFLINEIFWGKPVPTRSNY